MNNAFHHVTRPRHTGSTPSPSAALPLLLCAALCAAPQLARSAEPEKPAAPKLSEIKPEANPDAPSAPQPEPRTPAPKAPTKKTNEKPAPGHAFDGAAGTVENIRPVGNQTAALATLLDSLKKGETTPAAAFQSGQMNGAQALELLADTTIGTLQYRPLVHDLAQVVATKAPDLIADVAKVTPQAKVRLAPYFLEISDPRTVPFYESILTTTKTKLLEDATPIFKLSDYYIQIGDWKKATETRLRMKDYTNSPKFLANSQLEVARLYWYMGHKAEAEEFYQKAMNHNYGWAAGLSLFDRARYLMAEGKHDEARKLLSTPFSGPYSEQIQIPLLELLATSYYQTGDWEKARLYSQEVIAKSYNMKLLANEGLEVSATIAEAILKWSELFEKSPFVCEPNELYEFVWSGEDHSDARSPVTYKLKIKSFQILPFTVTCDNKAVRIEVAENTEHNYLGYSKEVKVEIPPGHIKKSFVSALYISSSAVPNFEVQVPVVFEVR